MKCAICGEEMRSHVYFVTYMYPGRTTMSINLCRPCMRQLQGSPAVSQLDHALAKAGWIQEPLPIDA